MTSARQRPPQSRRTDKQRSLPRFPNQLKHQPIHPRVVDIRR